MYLEKDSYPEHIMNSKNAVVTTIKHENHGQKIGADTSPQVHRW